MVLDATLINPQNYKVRFKGKRNNPGKGVALSLTTWYRILRVACVKNILKMFRSFVKPSSEQLIVDVK